MAITIKGIRVENVKIVPDNEKGGYKIESAEYSLISSLDKVLAKQSIGGYGSMALTPSLATIQAMEAFMALYRADVVGVLGLEG